MIRRLQCWLDGHDYVSGFGWRPLSHQQLMVTVCVRCGVRSITVEPPKVGPTGGPDDVPPNAVRIYQVVYIGTEAGEAYWCPICGRLDGAVYRGHGSEHIIPDVSQ